MIAHRLDLAPDDPLGVAADQGQDRLTTTDEQVENRGSQARRGPQGEDQSRGRVGRAAGIEGGSRPMERSR